MQILISSWCEDCRRWFCWVHSTLEAYIRKPIPTKDMTLCALKVYQVFHIIFLSFQRTQWKSVGVVAPEGWKIIRVFIFTFIGWSSSRWEWQKFVLADNIYGFTEMAFVLEYSGTTNVLGLRWQRHTIVKALNGHTFQCFLFGLTNKLTFIKGRTASSIIYHRYSVA